MPQECCNLERTEPYSKLFHLGVAMPQTRNYNEVPVQSFWQEHDSPHLEHTPILSYPYISIDGYVLSIYGYVG